MGVDFSWIGFVEFLCYWTIASFFVRFFAAKYHDSALGKAAGYLFM